MIKIIFIIHTKTLLFINLLKIKLSAKAKKAINTISSTSNVPEIPSKTCENSIDNAIIEKIPQYIARHFKFVSQTALIINNPDRNQSPSGKLNRNMDINIDSVLTWKWSKFRNDGFGKN